MKITKKSITCYSSERVYDVLIDDFDFSEMDAIEAESWAELATIGEVYQDDGVTITVDEE